MKGIWRKLFYFDILYIYILLNFVINFVKNIKRRKEEEKEKKEKVYVNLQNAQKKTESTNVTIINVINFDTSKEFFNDNYFNYLSIYSCWLIFQEREKGKEREISRKRPKVRRGIKNARWGGGWIGSKSLARFSSRSRNVISSPQATRVAFESIAV